MSSRFARFPWNLAGLFLAIRLMSLMGLPLEGLRGYGDLIHFYELAELGRPFIDYWVEFPPLFPVLNVFLKQLSGGQEHVYNYLLITILSFAQAGNLVIFGKLALNLFGETKANRIGWIYFAFLMGLSYGWWYFDPLAVLAMLVGLYWLLEGEDGRAGFALAAGILTKWFPALTLAVAWRFRPIRRALLVTEIALGTTAVVFAILFLLSPEMTLASLTSQISKGSWETVWALLDGNLSTGSFGSVWQRFDPATASLPQGNPPVVPPVLMLALFLGLGGWLFSRMKDRSDRSAISFLGLTWSIFLLWSPGWSPQWILYLLPIILLGMPVTRGIGFSLNLIFVSLLEWPILLSRGRFDLLWLPIVIRTMLLVLLAVAFGRVALSRQGEEHLRGVR